jgi:hypothetical protein
MKEYRATLTVNVFITADNEEEAIDKFHDMDISFTDPDTDESLQSDLIDIDVTEVGDIELDEYESELEEVDFDKTMKRCLD